jgi:uncharacterized membrane protein YfcA
VIGIGAGLIGGLFGVGGGVIVVPALMLWAGFGRRPAHATSVAVIVGAAGAAVIPFALEGDVDWTVAATVFAGAGIGAFFGARLLARIPAVWLGRGFVAIALGAAVRMWAA